MEESKMEKTILFSHTTGESVLSPQWKDKRVHDLLEHTMTLLHKQVDSSNKSQKQDNGFRLMPMCIHRTDNVTIQDLDELRTLVDDHYRLPNLFIADCGTCKTDENSVRAWLTKLRVQLADNNIKLLMQTEPNVTAYLDLDADELSLYMYHMV
jgi:hypothetical protein